MSNRKIKGFFAYLLLVYVIFCGCNQQKLKKEKAILVEYQGMKITRQIGLADIYDTTRFYKAFFIKDSVCFKYATDGNFKTGDIIEAVR